MGFKPIWEALKALSSIHKVPCLEFAALRPGDDKKAAKYCETNGRAVLVISHSLVLWLRIPCQPFGIFCWDDRQEML